MRATVAEELADFICTVGYDDIPERVRAKARGQVMSVVAAVHAGAEAGPAAAVLRAVRRGGAAGPCSVIATGERRALADAVLANSAASMALDFDDYLYLGHTGHSAVLGSLAVAEEEGRSTRDLLVAQIVANEVAGRVGASVVLGPQNGQTWSFIHAAAGAALAARLYGLTPPETAHALAIALYQPPYTLWPGFMGPGSKVLTAAGPTVAGIQAARLAREGLTGARDIFEHPRQGFWAAFAFAPLPGMMTGLGSAWVTDSLAYKRYPGCAYVDTTLDALFAALGGRRARTGAPLDAAAVRRVRVDASLLTVEMDNLAARHAEAGGRLAPVNVNFSVPFNVAIGILAGRHTAAELAPEFLDRREPELRALAAKVELRHDWGMTFEVVRAFDGVLGDGSALAALLPRDLPRVVWGYAAQLGGARRHGLDLGALARDHGGELAHALWRLLRRRGARGPRDLRDVDFSRFRMVLPARVTIETEDGARLSARQDVPVGAPGRERHLETAAEKLRRAAEPRLGAAGAEAAVALLGRLEEASLEEVAHAVCRAAPGRPSPGLAPSRRRR